MEMQRLNLRISRPEKHALHQLALEEGETMSVMLRRILRDELKRTGHLKDTNPTRTIGDGGQNNPLRNNPLI
jgi:hypothetical protein